MKRTFSLLLFAFCSILMTKAAFAATWYVRPDGGTRYSSNITSGQCDGLADAPYSGVGQNQHCAFKDFRYLYQDGAYGNPSVFPNYGWVISGGDTVILRGSIGTGVAYRIGWNNPHQSYDAATNQYWGIQGDPYDSGIPVPPSGTASAPTRILGENYASCSAPSAKTQVHGGYATGSIFNLSGASYVDIECLDLTDYSNCSNEGGTSNHCSKSDPLSDYASVGIYWSNKSTHDTINNITIHGLSGGMLGPTGDGVVMTNLDIHGKTDSGCNSDHGAGNPDARGVGSVLVQNFNISWNGCAEEYPIVHALPYYECLDQSSGGYGDGFGTATVGSAAPWNVHFDQGTVSYNTQDGLDALHLVGAGSSMTITRVNAFANEGQQIKIGGGHGVAQNNLITTNCNAILQAIPGTPAGFNSKLGNQCRAADTGILLTVLKGATTVFDNNTVYSASATGIEVECDTSAGACDQSSLIDFRNNIFIGFMNNPADGYITAYDSGTGDYSNPLYDGTGLWPFTLPGSSFANNIIYHPKSNFNCAATGQLCVDPQLTDETWHNYGYANATPVASSPAIGKGLSLSTVLTDLNGIVRAGVPTIGAIEVAGSGGSSSPTLAPSATGSGATSAPPTSAPTAPTAPSTGRTPVPVSTAPTTTPTSPTTTTTPPSSTGSTSSTTPPSTGSTTTTTPPTTKPSTPTAPAGPVATQVVLSVSKGPSAAIPIVLTAKVTSASGKVPTGSVVVYTSTKWALAAGTLDKNGTVSWQVPAGLTYLTVYGAYAGNSSFAGSTSGLLSGKAAVASVSR